ncbi:hypothetical protein J6O86_07555 [bacterium]|nr:hypothetical protein [bacterium]
MAINNDRSLLEQQILSNSSLKGKELENLKARLATLSEQQLQAELSKSLSGNNKGEWYTGVMLEHNESVIMRNNHDQTTYTDDNGNEISELKDGDEVLERTIKSTDDKGNVFETTVTFSGGRPLTQTKTKNGNTTETTTYRYNDDAEVPFVTVETKKADKSKVMTNVLEVDKNGNFDNEDFIDRKTKLLDGTEISVTKENGHLTEEVTKFGKEKTTTVYNGDNIQDLDSKKLNRLKQNNVYYDGKGNTYVQINAGETAQIMADRINKKRGAGQPQITAQQIIELNPNLVKRNGEFVLQKFENGAKGLGEVRIPGEFDADSPFIKTRQSIQKANNLANQAEYDKQVAKKVTEKTDTKVATELANNGFKPTRENAIFYNRFNALNSSQQQNVLSVIKYCRSQKITDPNKIKARILETFPEINLFDSGKVIPMNSSFGTPAFQRKNPVALETFLTDTLKLDLKSETGQMVYERLSSKSQEELNKLNAQNFVDLSKANFVEIAHRLEANGIDIRSRQEHQIENNSPRMKAEQEKRELRESASQNIALAYDNAINIIKQYQGNQGWINVGFYREKLGKLLSNVNPTKINTCFDDVIKELEKEKKFAVGYLKGKSTNDKEFKEAFKKVSGGVEYNEANMKAFLDVAQDPKANFEDEKYNEKFWNAYNKAFGVAKTDKNGKVYYEPQVVKQATSRTNFQQYVDGAGDIVLMLLGTEAIGKGVAWAGGKLVSKVSPYVPKFLANAGSKTVMTIGSNNVTVGRVAANMASQSASFTLWDASKNYINLKTKDIQYSGEAAEKEWEAYKEGNVESAKFGAFAGALNTTVVGKVINGTMKMFEKPIAKAVSKVGKSFETTSAMTGADVMKTFMLNQTPGMLAKTAGTIAEIGGFTLYETANEVVEELIKKDGNGEHRLPTEWTEDGLTSYLWNKLKGQTANLGEIKAISRLMFMHKGAIKEQARLMDENLAKCETLKNVKIKKTEVNGREIFEVTMSDGNRKVANSVEEVIANCNVLMQLDVISNAAKENETVDKKSTPQGMNAEEDALIQKARKENPATVVEEKVRRQWQQHDIETPAPDEKVDLFNLDPNAGLKEPVQNIENEVTSLIFKGKLNETLTQRYDEMGKVFTEIAQKHAADIEALAKANPKNKQAVADGIVKILAQELGMEGFEPPIVFENTNGGDGFADWPNGRIVINEDITNVKKLTSMISHEFVHMLQYRDVLAQYGEQGLRDLIANDKSIPENEKESHIQKALNNPYNQHLLQSYDFQKAQAGTVNDYIRRIYKDEFTNTVGTENMPEYVNQASERGAYSSQEKVDRGLDESNLGELSIGEIGLSNAELVQQRLAKMREKIGGKKSGQDISFDEPLNAAAESAETVEIDEFGQVHTKSVPAGTLPKTENMTKQEFMSYINTLELTQSVAGKDVKYKWTRLLNSEEIKELGDLYEKHPELVSDLIKNRVANLQKNQYCYAAEIIGIVKAYEEYGEPVKTLMNYSFKNANGEDSKFEASSIKSILRRPDKDFIIESLQNPDTKIKSLLKTMVDTAQMPNNKFIENLKILDKNYDKLIKDKNNETRINEVIEELTEAVKKFDIDAYKIAQEKMFDLYGLFLPKTEEGYVSPEQAEEVFNQIGVGSHSIGKILEIYGDKVPQKVIDFAQEFYTTNKIDFSEYGIDEGEYISTKSRTLKTALKLSTDKSGNTNIEELNKIIGFLTKDGRKIHVNDLLNYLRYGKNSDGKIDLETVKKVKSLIQPDADVLVEVRNGIKEIRDQFENTESFDYEAYNKVLNSIHSPLEVGQMLNIIKATRQNTNARKSFMDNPTEYLKYVQNRYDKSKLINPTNINNIPVVEYDAETLKQLNEVYEIESISGATAAKVRVTPENMETVKMLLNQNKNYNNDEIADLVSAYESAPDLFNKIYNENITPDEELFLEYTCRKYNSEPGLRLFIEKGFSFENVNNLNPVVTDCLADAGKRCTEAQVDLLCKISNTAKELEITPKVMRMISKIDPKDPQAIIDIIECFPEKIDELYLGRLHDLLGNTSPEKLAELKKLISERKDDIQKAQLNLTYTLSHPERALDILDGTGLYEKPMTQDEFIDEICTLAGRPRDAIQEEHMDDIINMYNEHYMLDPVLMSEIFAKDSEGQYVHTQTFIAGTLMDNAIDITNKKLIHKLMIADKTLKKPDMEYDSSIGVSKTEFEFLKATAKYFGEEGYRCNNISETIENFDNEISQRIATEILNNSEGGVTSVLPKSINNIKTEAEANRFLSNFNELKQKYREYNKNNLAEEALVINTPEMRQLCEDLHKNYPNLTRISNLLRIAQEGGYEKIRHMLDNPTEQNVKDLREMHDGIYWEAMDNVAGLNVFKLDLQPQQLLSLAEKGNNLKERHLLDSDKKLSAQDIYDMADVDNDIYYKTFPKYSHLLGKMPASTIMNLRENLDGYIEKGLLNYGINSATMLDYFDKNPESFEQLKQNSDYQMIAKYSADSHTYTYFTRKPNSECVNWLKDIDATLNASGKEISQKQRDLIKTVTNNMTAAMDSDGNIRDSLINLDIAKDLCLNFENYGLTIGQTANIIRHTDKYITPFINKLLYDKNLDFPKEFIPDIVSSIQSRYADKLPLAEKLCYEKECSPQLISGILKATRDNTIDLVNRLCFDKELNFPKEMIKPLVETIFAKDNAKITEILVEGMQNTKLTPTDIIRVQDLIDNYRSKHSEEFKDIDFDRAKQLVDLYRQKGLLEIASDGKPIFKDLEINNFINETFSNQSEQIRNYMLKENQELITQYLAKPHQKCANEMVRFVREKNQILNAIKGTVKDSNPEFVEFAENLLNTNESDFLFTRRDYHKNKLLNDIMGTYKLISYIDERPQDYLNGNYKEEIITALKEIRSYKKSDKPTYEKLSDVEKQIVQGLNEDIEAYIGKNKLEILKAVSIADTETVKLFLDKRFHIFRGKINEITRLSEDKQIILADIMRNGKRQNSLGQPDKLTGQQKVDMINLINAYNGTIEDFNKYKTPLKGRAYMLDIEQLQKDILSDVLKENGMSEEEINKIDFSNVNWDLRYVSLLTKHPHRDEGELSEVIRESTKGNFQRYIKDTSNPHGKANEMTQQKFAQQGANYDAWTTGPKEQKFTIGGVEYTVKLWNRDPQESLFDGSYTTCCTALDHTNGGSMANYLLNTAINVVEIKDASGQTVGMSRCYIGELDGVKTLVMENIEVNNGLISEMNKDHTTCELTQGLFNYMSDFADMVLGEGSPVYLSTSYHKIGEEGFRGMPLQSIKETKLLGNISKSSLYLNTHAGYVGVNEGTIETKPASFHVVRKKAGLEE